MPRSVRDLRDLPLLYVVRGENEMGAPKKTRAELLDKMIQFIWDYQDRHNGETPMLNVVGRHVGVEHAGVGYYINLLVDEGRLSRIGARPFRVTITEHKENQKAIDRFKRIRERLERADEAERQRIRNEQEHLRESEQRAEDSTAALNLVGDDTVVADRSKTEVEVTPFRMSEVGKVARNWGRQSHSEAMTPIERFDDAQARVREVNREVKAMMPKLLKITDERDLVFELVSRGYRVDKVR